MTKFTDRQLFGAKPRSDVWKALEDERDVSGDDKIARSKIGTKIKRLDSSKMSRINDHRDYDIGKGLRQNIVAQQGGGDQLANQLHDVGTKGTNPFAQSSGAYGDDTGSPTGLDANHIIDVRTGKPPKFNGDFGGGAYDDSPSSTGFAGAGNAYGDGDDIAAWYFEDHAGGNDVGDDRPGIDMDQYDPEIFRTVDTTNMESRKPPSMRFKRLRNFANNIFRGPSLKKGQRELPTRDEMLVQNHYNSVKNRYTNKDIMLDRGIAENSIVGALNARGPHMKAGYFFEYFRAKIDEKFGNDYPPMTDDLKGRLSDIWNSDARTDDEKLGKKVDRSAFRKLGLMAEAIRAKANNLVGDDTKAERGRLALEMAMLKAHYEALLHHEEQRQPVKLHSSPDHDPTVDPDNQLKKPFDYKDKFATTVDDSQRVRDNFHKLPDHAIDSGVKQLNYFARNQTDHFRQPKFNFPGVSLLADSSPGMDRLLFEYDEQEIYRLECGFEDICNEFNDQVDQNIQVRDDRRNAMAKSVLPELGMPLNFEDVTHEDFSRIHDRAVDHESRFGSYGIFRMARGLLTTTILPLTHIRAGWAWLRGHERPQWVQKDYGIWHFDTKYFDRHFRETEERMKSEALQDKLADLHDQNFHSTKRWILEQYKYDPKNADLSGTEKLFDPHGLYAAFGNASKEEIVDSIRQQLALSRGISLHPRPKDSDKAEDPNLPKGLIYPEDMIYPADKARYARMVNMIEVTTDAVYCGMLEGLEEAAADQLRLRADTRLTQDANTYVTAHNAYMRKSCNEAWQGVNNMFDAYGDHRRREEISHKISSRLNDDGVLMAMRDDLNSADQHGVFTSAGGYFGDEEMLYKLDKPRVKLLEENLDAAESDLKAAGLVAKSLNDIMGSDYQFDSIAHIERQLDDDLQRGFGGAGLKEVQESKLFEALRDELKEVNKKINELVDTQYLWPDQAQKLKNMAADLSIRIDEQETLRAGMQEVEKQILNAGSKADLEGGALKKLMDNWGLNTWALRDKNSMVQKSDFIGAMLDNMKVEASAKVKAARSMFDAQSAAENAMLDIETRFRNGAINHQQAMDAARDVRDSFGSTNDRFKNENIFDNVDIATKWDAFEDRLSTWSAGFAAKALGVDPQTADAPLSKRAAQTLDTMHKAGVLDDATVAAFRQNLKPDGMAKLNEQLEALNLPGAGITPKSMIDFAEVLFPTNQEAALHFKLEIARHLDTGPEFISKMRAGHYRRLAGRLIGNAAPMVQDVHDRIIKNVAQKMAMSNNNVDPSKKSLKMDNAYDEIYNIDDVDSDIDDDDYDDPMKKDIDITIPQNEIVNVGVQSNELLDTNPFNDNVAPSTNPFDEPVKTSTNPFDEVNDEQIADNNNNNDVKIVANYMKPAKQDNRQAMIEVLTNVVELAPHHPLFKNRVDWVKDAASDLRKLVVDRDETLTKAQINRALRLAEEMAILDGGSDDEIAKLRDSVQKRQAAVVQRQLAAEFGIDPDADLDKPQNFTAVGRAAFRAIGDSTNAKGLQNIVKRRVVLNRQLKEQQQQAALVRGAMIEPLKEFAQLLNDQNIDPNDPDAVMAALTDKKFRKTANLLLDLCHILDARHGAAQDWNGGQDSERFRSNMRKIAQLAPKVRDFDPNTLKAKNSFFDQIEASWKNVNSWNVARDLDKNDDVKNVVDKFSAVWKHMKAMQAIDLVGKELQNELDGIDKQYKNLLNKTQTHRSDQIVQMAILKDFEASGLSMSEYRVQPKNIETRLEKWGQAAALKGFVQRNDNVMHNRLSSDLIAKWRDGSNGLPPEQQKEVDAMSAALDDFDKRLKDSRSHAGDLKGTPLDPIVLSAPIRADDRDVDVIAPREAGRAYGAMLSPRAKWHDAPEWKGAALNDMQSMSVAAFTDAMRDGLDDYATSLGNGPTQEEHRGWVKMQQETLNELRDLDRLANQTIASKRMGMPPSKERVDEIKKLAAKLMDKRNELYNPNVYETRGYGVSKNTPDRYHRDLGPGHFLKRQKQEHFLNKVDAALHDDIGKVVTGRMAELGLKL